MSLVSMPQLVEGQAARLDVVESLSCRIIGLSGRDVVIAGDEVVLRLTDEIRLGQRRTFSRAPLPLPVRVRVRDHGVEWSTDTRDVSAGGVGIGRDRAAPFDGPLELRIQVGDHEVVATAVGRARDRRRARPPDRGDHPGGPAAARLARARVSPATLTH